MTLAGNHHNVSWVCLNNGAYDCFFAVRDRDVRRFRIKKAELNVCDDVEWLF